MIGKTISHYKILEKLGEGGMGVVYKAEDTKLKRLVALKFLPSSLMASEAEKTRFVHEAQAAAALNHPNICTIYEINEADGQSFIAMEFIEGQSLKDKIAAGPLKIDEALNIAMQVAEGLHAAHEKKITHRDIKPANVMITTKGQAKIMDFGLAKLAGRTVVTKEGMTLGTVAYMSPEQGRGEEVDRRTDIWAFGVVLYEMITGQHPFKGMYEQAVMYSIMNEEPEPMTGLRTGVPMELERIVNKCLAKNPGERYQHVDEMLVDLRVIRKTLESPSVTVKSKPAATAPAKSKRVLPYVGVGLAALLVGLIAALLWLRGGRGKAIDSVAVLPFANAGADPETEYLSDGISESLIRSLSQLPRLKVISFSVVSRYKGKDKTVQEIARELEVQTVLVGRLAQRGEALTISAELVNADDNRHIWGEQYHRKLADLLSLQDEITEALSEKLQPHISDAEKRRATKRFTRNLEAHQLYLKGRYYTAKYTKENFEKGLACFQQAVEKDPNYALAYDGLAYYYIAAFEWMLSPREALPKAREAALKTLALDETLAEAHASLGAFYFYHDWDWPAAEREFKRAIQLNPNYTTAYLHYGWYLAAAGRFDEALAVAKRGHELDPLSTEIGTAVGGILSMTGQNDLAITQLNSTLELDPNYWFARVFLAGIYEAQGRLADACAEYEKAHALEGEFSEALAGLGKCYVQQGKIDEARKILLELKRRAEKNYVPPYFFFMIHYALGEKEEALPWFEAAFEQRCVYLLWDKIFSYSSYQREDPRFALILDKVGVKRVE
jgi:serine/threonine-protein kinase